jgi:hypothetical protein
VIVVDIAADLNDEDDTGLTQQQLSVNRRYNQTQWLMTSAGYRWPLYGDDNPTPIKRPLPEDLSGPIPSHPNSLTVPAAERFAIIGYRTLAEECRMSGFETYD